MLPFARLGLKSSLEGTSINSLKPRWRRCPYIFGRPQNAHLLRVNCAFSAAHHIKVALPAQLDRIYRSALDKILGKYPKSV